MTSRALPTNQRPRTASRGGRRKRNQHNATSPAPPISTCLVRKAPRTDHVVVSFIDNSCPLPLPRRPTPRPRREQSDKGRRPTTPGVRSRRLSDDGRRCHRGRRAGPLHARRVAAGRRIVRYAPAMDEEEDLRHACGRVCSARTVDARGTPGGLDPLRGMPRAEWEGESAIADELLGRKGGRRLAGVLRRAEKTGDQVFGVDEESRSRTELLPSTNGGAASEAVAEGKAVQPDKPLQERERPSTAKDLSLIDGIVDDQIAPQSEPVPAVVGDETEKPQNSDESERPDVHQPPVANVVSPVPPTVVKGFRLQMSVRSVPQQAAEGHAVYFLRNNPQAVPVPRSLESK
ncbi:MAG: hypothetical protein BJ554DRAFT_2034 [Olpidium bornovanus]|uniref:Uncharacterized protein n=1 Tax=Olpidium bornovanus TaxID=278681 RepID=A0A8H8A0T1_9FUNG|nr:MAG: hypothetical protein BJ554DRAFT_2034 [Olpidium bornovanus]